jgi:ssRNA-specific RNase YbeY (16S rRNA maturation enzyme)
MTDTSKYKNVSLSLETYDKVEKLRKVIIPDDPNTSRSKTVTLLVNRELRKLNGKERKNRDRTNS